MDVISSIIMLIASRMAVRPKVERYPVVSILKKGWVCCRCLTSTGSFKSGDNWDTSL